MARWADIEQALNIDIYFYDAHSPWQRASNEQTNARLRRWLPKHTNLNINPAHLAIIEDNLNHMPRKLHNWQSAHNTYTNLNCTTSRVRRSTSLAGVVRDGILFGLGNRKRVRNEYQALHRRRTRQAALNA